MDKSRDWENHLWLVLFPILLIILCFEDGVVEGFGLFAFVLYVWSFIYLVALLIASLYVRALHAKTYLLVMATIVILYTVFSVASGNFEVLKQGAIFGAILGPTFGVIFVFLLSPLAPRVRAAESTLYRKIREWFSGKNL